MNEAKALRSSIRGYRLQRLPAAPRWAQILAKLSSVLVSLLLMAAFIESSGLSAGAVASRVLRSTVGSSFGMQQVALLATPLILTGLAAAICIKMRLWNIGADGQLYMGAWAAAGIGLHIIAPEPVAFVVMFIGGAAFGALWMLLPAFAWAYWYVNEIITTLMLNFVAVLWVNIFAIDVWKDNAVLRSSRYIPYNLPKLSGSLHIGILVAVGLAVVLWLYLERTTLGYEVKLIGLSRRAAEYVGMAVRKNTIIIMLLSGAIAGVAGVIEATGSAHRLNSSLSNQYGYLGIIIAVLAGGNVLATVIVGLLFSVLLNAGIILQTQGLSVNLVVISTGLILLFAAVGDMVAHYRLVRVGADDITPQRDRNVRMNGPDTSNGQHCHSSSPEP